MPDITRLGPRLWGWLANTGWIGLDPSSALGWGGGLCPFWLGVSTENMSFPGAWLWIRTSWMRWLDLVEPEAVPWYTCMHACSCRRNPTLCSQESHVPHTLSVWSNFPLAFPSFSCTVCSSSRSSWYHRAPWEAFHRFMCDLCHPSCKMCCNLQSVWDRRLVSDLLMGRLGRVLECASLFLS